eukprot:422738_1
MLKHWTYFEGDSRHISPKYASLKDETLNNNIHHIALETFNCFLDKAFIHASSTTGRRLKAMNQNAENNKHEIPVNLPMTVSHILVIMFYCNLTDLQRLYKKYGCRQLYANEDLDELKPRNKEIAHWYRLLYEAIYFYGSIVGTNDAYYTGINTRVCFDSFAPMFCCPLSTTTQQHVAHNFSECIGIVVKIVPLSGSTDMCFNVEWLSNYKNESERLFFDAGRVRIEDIMYFDACARTICSNAHYVSAFKLWSSLFGGEFFNIYLRGKHRKKTQRTLVALIKNYNQNNGIGSANNTANIRTHLYIQRVFYHLLQQLCKPPTYLIRSEFDLLDESLKRELLSFNNNGDNPPVISLSPLVSSLIGGSLLVVLRQFIWILSSEQIDDLKTGEKGIYTVSEQYSYQLNNGDNVSFRMGIRNESAYEYTGFQLINKSSKQLRGTFRIEVSELNWTVNRWPFVISRGQDFKIQFFEDKLLRDVEF